MNAIQKKLKKIKACKEAVVRAGRYRTAKEAWHGWRRGEDLLWLLVALRMPRKRLQVVLDAVVNQTQEWARAAEGKERVAEAESAARAAAVAARAARAAYYADAAVAAAREAREAADAAARAAYYAAETAAAAGLMTYEDAQAALANLVRREVPWEGVKELWEKKTKGMTITNHNEK